jgi:hypothetical protein
MNKSTATVENITPPTERDLGGVKVQLVEVTFSLDEHNDQSRIATQARFEELDKVWGVSTDTGRLWQQDWSKIVYAVENGVFVATLPVDPAWKIGKRFSIVLQNVSN